MSPSCFVQKFNGFYTVKIEKDREIGRNFLPIDIIYDPVVSDQVSIDCYFSNHLDLALKGSCTTRGKIDHISAAWQCYYCSNYYSRKDGFDRHFKHCSGQPGIAYNFNTQNLVLFEDDIKYRRDIPFTAYIEFETTAPISSCLDPEDRKIFAISYVIIFAFHPQLNKELFATPWKN